MFSVVMPVWNRAAMVGRAIESVLAQTCQDFELLVVDDGSEDDSAAVVEPYLGDRVRLYRQEHRGHSAARNFGLEQSGGDWLAYLDSDNTWRPHFLETIAAALERAPQRHQVAYCLANRLERDPGTGEWVSTGQMGGGFDYRRLWRGNYIDLNALVHSRHALQLVGGFDESLPCYVDWDLVLRLTARYEPLFVPEVLVDYLRYSSPNAVSCNPTAGIKERVRQQHRRSLTRVTKIHDTNVYEWDRLPSEKIDNWRQCRPVRYDTQDYRAACWPHMLQIEPTSLCNLSCPLCPAGRDELNRERRNMTLDEFRGIIDDMERWLLFLVMWDWGEPCINPQLPDMLRYAADRRIHTVTSTNAHFLQDEAYVEALLQSGLSTLIVAVDSLCAESYSVYRQHGDLDRVIAGLQGLVELKRRLQSPTKINLRAVVMRQNEHEMPALRALARSIGVDRFTIKSLNPSCGGTSLDEELLPLSPRYRRYRYRPGTYDRVRRDAPCSRVWFMCNVLSNGDVVPCTYDYDAQMRVGNVFETPLSELWNGPAFRELRRRVYQEKDSIPRCRDCDVSFQRSRSGWFPQSIDFNATPATRALELWDRFKRGYLPRRWWRVTAK